MAHLSGAVIAARDNAVSAEEVPGTLRKSTIAPVPAPEATRVQVFGRQIPCHRTFSPDAQTIAEHRGRGNSLHGSPGNACNK